MDIIGTQIKFTVQTVKEVLKKASSDNPSPKSCGGQGREKALQLARAAGKGK